MGTSWTDRLPQQLVVGLADQIVFYGLCVHCTSLRESIKKRMSRLAAGEPMGQRDLEMGTVNGGEGATIVVEVSHPSKSTCWPETSAKHQLSRVSMDMVCHSVREAVRLMTEFTVTPIWLSPFTLFDIEGKNSFGAIDREPCHESVDRLDLISGGGFTWTRKLTRQRQGYRALLVYPEYTGVPVKENKLCIFNTIDRTGVVYNMLDDPINPDVYESIPAAPPLEDGVVFHSLNPVGYAYEPSFGVSV